MDTAAADRRLKSQTLNFLHFCVKDLCKKFFFIKRWHWSGSPCSLALANNVIGSEKTLMHKAEHPRKVFPTLSHIIRLSR